MVRSVFDRQTEWSQGNLTFENNSALLGAGSQIYGGWLGWLVDDNGVSSFNFENTKRLLNLTFKNQNSSDSEIASNPVRICLCVNGYQNCSITSRHTEIHGYQVNLNLIAVGQMFTPVIAYVEASLSSKHRYSTNSRFGHNIRPRIESLQLTCTNIAYKIIYSKFTEETLMFRAYLDYHNNERTQDPPEKSDNTSMTEVAMYLFQQLSVQLKFKKCPLGFYLDETNRNCVCNQSVIALGFSCDFYDYKISRGKEQWIGVTYHDHLSTIKMPGVIAHQHCPFDYCRTDNGSLLIHLEDPDKQCAFNRTGILCGGCKPNLSRVLGSSRCKVLKLHASCHTSFWAPSGLIFGIFSSGTKLDSYGWYSQWLIFYANIIEAQPCQLLHSRHFKYILECLHCLG